MSTSDQHGHKSPRPSGSAAGDVEQSSGLSEQDVAARRIVEGYVEAKVSAAHVRQTTLVAARVDPFGASQYEVSCELELGNGNRVLVTIDVETATNLGRILIAQAALSWKAGDDEMDWHMKRHERSARNSEDVDDDLPF